MPIGGFDYLKTGYAPADSFISDYDTSTTAIASSTTADTFGSWNEIISSVGDRPVIIEVVSLPDIEGTIKQREIELGVGAASSETTVWISPTYSQESGAIKSWQYYPMIWVPSGSRVSARVRDESTTAFTTNVTIQYRKV